MSVYTIPDSIDTYGDEEVTKQIVGRTITEYIDKTVKRLRQSVFYGTQITRVVVPACTEIGRDVFFNTPIAELVVGSGCTLANTIGTSSNVKSPIVKGTGAIYVPDSEVEAFKTATNWSTYANVIKGWSEFPD